MIRLLVTVASTLVLLGAPALAQQPGNPAGMTPGTGPHQPNNSDRVFVHAAAIGGMAEVEFGRWLSRRARAMPSRSSDGAWSRTTARRTRG
jgi:putative membrane protein